MTILRLFLTTALVLGSLTAARAAEITVFAAASLKTALDEIAADWTARSEDNVAISYAGSSQLAKQIEAGAPADIFISAAKDWMDKLEQGNLLRPGTRMDLLGNTLVLVAHGKNAPAVDIAPGFDLAGLVGDGRLAMALVDSVPAGVYGKASLTALGIWGAVEPKVAQADNVRAALALVARGEAPFGIVYATDAKADDTVTVVGTFPADSHPPIVYPAAIMAASANPAADAFFAALTGESATATFRKQGFIVPAK